MSAEKPHGWCVLHHFNIMHEKFVRHCSKALKGKICRHFTYARPAWTKAAKGTFKHRKGERHARQSREDR